MSTIRTLDRAFSILRIVAKYPDGVGVNAVAAELGLAKSTTSRLLTAMNGWGVVERTKNNRFRIGPEPVRWICGAKKMLPLKIGAPLSLYTDVVRPEWIDYNQHMSEGYYGVAFGYTTDAFMDFVGLDAAYRARSKATIYTVESHTTFLRELKVGTHLRFTTQVLGFDPKRIHIFHQMFHADETYLASTMEAMLLHVNDEPRTVPMPAEILEKVEAVYKAHTTLPHPPQAGRHIGLE